MKAVIGGLLAWAVAGMIFFLGWLTITVTWFGPALLIGVGLALVFFMGASVGGDW